jgi:hypothetical protein
MTVTTLNTHDQPLGQQQLDEREDLYGVSWSAHASARSRRNAVNDTLPRFRA